MSQITILAGPDSVATQIEQVVDRRMRAQESLGLKNAFESPHTPLLSPRPLVRLLRPVIGVPVRNVKRIRTQIPMGNPVTAQFGGDDFPGLVSMTPDQAPEKPLGSPAISSAL